MCRMSWCGAMTEWCAGPWVLDSRWSDSSLPVHCCGSGSERIRIHFGRLDLDPDPHWEYGSGSRRAKINHKSEENSCFWSARCSLMRYEDLFSCSFDVLYGGLGISKLHFFIEKIKFFSSCKFFPNFRSSKPWIRIRIETSADPQHWYRLICADLELTLLYHCYQGYADPHQCYAYPDQVLIFKCGSGFDVFYFYADPAGSGSCSCSSSKRNESATAGL